jgi:hypothetical protein
VLQELSGLSRHTSPDRPAGFRILAGGPVGGDGNKRVTREKKKQMIGLTPTTIDQLEQIELREPQLVSSAKKLFSQIEKHAAGGECHASTAPSALWLISALGKLAEQQPEMNVQTVLHLAAEAMPKATEMYAACAQVGKLQGGTVPPPSSCE